MFIHYLKVGGSNSEIVSIFHGILLKKITRKLGDVLKTCNSIDLKGLNDLTIYINDTVQCSPSNKMTMCGFYLYILFVKIVGKIS